jgi:hypothetical protein
MVQRNGFVCQACGGRMIIQMDPLDLGWAGDGPYARDDDFAGILADVFSCGACGRVAIVPARIGLSLDRAAA